MHYLVLRKSRTRNRTRLVTGIQQRDEIVFKNLCIHLSTSLQQNGSTLESAYFETKTDICGRGLN